MTAVTKPCNLCGETLTFKPLVLLREEVFEGTLWTWYGCDECAVGELEGRTTGTPTTLRAHHKDGSHVGMIPKVVPTP